MNVVLVNPEIPQNTGNVARTCVMTGTALHLAGKLGFSLEDRYLRRAGLDYWPYLNLTCYPDFDSLLRRYGEYSFYFFSTRGRRCYTEVDYSRDDFLVFGSETEGLPLPMLKQWSGSILKIPMIQNIERSLNLSNSVAIVLFEALRQQGFPGME